MRDLAAGPAAAGRALLSMQESDELQRTRHAECAAALGVSPHSLHVSCDRPDRQKRTVVKPQAQTSKRCGSRQMVSARSPCVCAQAASWSATATHASDSATTNGASLTGVIERCALSRWDASVPTKAKLLTWHAKP